MLSIADEHLREKVKDSAKDKTLVQVAQDTDRYVQNKLVEKSKSQIGQPQQRFPQPPRKRKSDFRSRNGASGTGARPKFSQPGSGNRDSRDSHGNTSRDSNRNNNREKSYECFNCGEVGHRAFECTKEKSKENPKGEKSASNQQPGKLCGGVRNTKSQHQSDGIYAHCLLEGIPYLTLLDTGASCTINVQIWSKLFT